MTAQSLRRLFLEVVFVSPVCVCLVAGALVGCNKSSGTTEVQTCPMTDAGATVTDAPAAPPDGGSLASLPPPSQISVATLYKAPLVIEGLTADGNGNFYAAGRGGMPCPVWRVGATSGMATVVGNIPSPCSPNGLTFNSAGDLFIGDGNNVYKLTPNDQTPPMATVFATGVPGANGLAFDRRGALWVSDGTTGQGRVWKITPDGTPTEAFRVQALANDVNAVAVDGGAMVGGVGRDPRALPPGSISITATARAAADTLGSVPIVANGVAFSSDGTLYVADTGRGAIWKVQLDAQGAIQSPMGCDTTFPADTLCLQTLLVAHPILEGLDGIALDVAGNIWGTANERNAVAVVTPQGAVREVYRNPPDSTTRLRNMGPLEFPTSPFLLDHRLCITQSDVSRRDNAPNTTGEVGPGVTGPLLGKISCLDVSLPQAGLPLPVQ